MSKEQVQSAADRKAELLARKAQREAALEAEREAHELALLELEERLSEGGRTRGRQFEILDLTDLGEGLVALKCDVPGIQASFKAFSTAKVTDATLDAFVVQCLESPDAKSFREIVARRPAIMDRALGVVIELLGARKADSQKKA